MTTGRPVTPKDRAEREARRAARKKRSADVPAPPRTEKNAKPPTRVATALSRGGYGTLGFDIVLSMAIGFLAGNWLDGRFGTRPWLAVLGSTFGIAAAVRFVLRYMRDMREVTEKEEREQGNPAPVWDDAKPEAEEEPWRHDTAEGGGEGEPAPVRPRKKKKRKVRPEGIDGGGEP